MSGRRLPRLRRRGESATRVCGDFGRSHADRTGGARPGRTSNRSQAELDVLNPERR
jgi:hypothetical protein